MPKIHYKQKYQNRKYRISIIDFPFWSHAPVWLQKALKRGNELDGLAPDRAHTCLMNARPPLPPWPMVSLSFLGLSLSPLILVKGKEPRSRAMMEKKKNQKIENLNVTLGKQIGNGLFHFSCFPFQHPPSSASSKTCFSGTGPKLLIHA